MKWGLPAVVISAICLFAQPTCYALDTIKLNAPDLDKGISIMQALKQRHSTRTFQENKKLTLQQLSNLLWAADGVNREDGRRTAPSAMAKYPVSIYVLLQEGIYLYEPTKQQLSPILEGDLRKEAGMQAFVATAPVNLVFVADVSKFQAPSSRASTEDLLRMAAIEIGHQAQNVYLYCASEGLGTVIRASINRDAFGKLLKLGSDQTILAAQTVGYPK